ncbi:Ger(x)C family spore germination C-terminal domain-containing protein, partial [Pseudomonas sp. FW305-BF6]|uniref:Ger(x)C family spore germination C-terminal domain-containing protein n=1 Tax=Pseudomonas sp. FW305-BF6 TaxID=2070673 RepID=UPI001304D5E4
KERSTLLLLLMDGLVKEGYMSLILERDRSISFRITDEKRKLKLVVDKAKRKITGKINLEIDINIANYSNNFNEKVKIASLNKDISA